MFEFIIIIKWIFYIFFFIKRIQRYLSFYGWSSWKRSLLRVASIFWKQKLHIIYITTSSRNLHLFIVNANHVCLCLISFKYLWFHIDKVCKPLSLLRDSAQIYYYFWQIKTIRLRMHICIHLMYTRKAELFIRNTFIHVSPCRQI